MTIVTEENAVRAIAVMTEQTAKLGVDELLLPENYLQEYSDFVSAEDPEDPEEIEVYKLIEVTEKETAGSGEGVNYDSRKGKARENVKKPASGKEPEPRKKSKSAEQDLNELVG